jgi:hypothetical protein
MSTDKPTAESTYLNPAEKALGESFRFYIDYIADLEDVDPVDTIASSTWAIDGTLVEETSGFNDTNSWIRVSGGTKIGTLHRLINTVITAQGDTIVRLLTVKIVNVHVKRPDPKDVTYADPLVI